MVGSDSGFGDGGGINTGGGFQGSYDDLTPRSGPLSGPL